jgi:hypothetical protein
MGVAYSTNGEIGMHIGFWWGRRKDRDLLFSKFYHFDTALYQGNFAVNKERR